MDSHDLIKLIIIIAMLIMSAYFSATETAFSTLNRIRLKTLAEDGDRRAARALKLTNDYDRLLSTILIGNNIVNIVTASLSTLLFVKLIGEGSGAAVSTAVTTVVVLIFGEISPKSIAKESPERFAMFSAPFIGLLVTLFTPLNFLFCQWKKLLSRIFKSEEDKGMTEEELISIIEEAEEEGDLDKEETDLIKSAIEFNDLEVSDIFTPRIDVTAIAMDTPAEEIRQVFAETGYSRLPVYDGDIDNIIGLLYYKDFYNASSAEQLELSGLLKSVLFVARNQKINDLLRELQEKQMHLAVVTDEFGSTAGIVTLEDVLEEIVGEIWDEHDKVEEDIKTVGENEYIVSGKANIAKVMEELDVDEEPEALTVNGWAMTVLGRLPVEGDTFEADGLAAKVMRMNGRRIENLHVFKLSPEQEEQEEDA